jgi:HEAT repeat protein
MHKRRLAGLAGGLLACLAHGGCANFWDDITSNDFKFKSMFARTDPYAVLKDSDDGDQRARALRALKEPKQHGGSDADQEAVLNILRAAATTERQPLCRIAAITTLGRFKDPRAVDALVEAFEQAPFEKAPKLRYPPETTNLIQTQAVTALGKTGQPAAVDLLVRVVREPRPASDVSDQEKQLHLDLHLAAVRALSNFPHYQATEALVHVLKTEKDVALRDRAHQSLQLATGKKLPPDPQTWEDLLHASPDQAPPRHPIQTVAGWFRRQPTSSAAPPPAPSDSTPSQ